MSEKKSQFKASEFATIQKSGSVSVKLNEFLGSEAGKLQLKRMEAVREVAQRIPASDSTAADKRK
jgi:hypothetical protein